MNQSTLTQLKILVERAVRPVPASSARKLRMREELLAHVSAVFDEEAAKLGDEHAALAQTKQRFGNPDELAGQLLRSIPARDFGERFMGRIVLATIIWFALFGAGEFPMFPGRWLLNLCLGGIGFIFLGDLARRAVDAATRRCWQRAVVVAASSMALFLGLLFGSLTFLFDEWSRPTDMFNFFMLTAALTWGVVTALLETAARYRAYVDWESLQIE